jgi:hypothetical protein
MAIERIEGERPTLLAFRIEGRIEQEDVEAMAREVLATFEERGEIDMLILLQDWDGISAGAILSRERLETQVRAVRHVRKYAVVGPPGWAATLINGFDRILPVDARTFDSGDEAAARAWLEKGAEALDQ